MFVEITRKSPKKTLKTPSFSPEVLTIVWLQPQASCPALAQITWHWKRRLGALKYKQFVTKKQGPDQKTKAKSLRFEGLPVYQIFGILKNLWPFCWKLLLFLKDFFTTESNYAIRCNFGPPKTVHLLMTQLRCLLKVPHFVRWFLGKKLSKWVKFNKFHPFHPWPPWPVWLWKSRGLKSEKSGEIS